MSRRSLAILREKPKHFGKKQYQATLTDPVAFHRYILLNPFELSEPQKLIMRSIAKYPETLVIAGSKGGKSTFCADITLWRIYLLLQMDSPQKQYSLNPNSHIWCMVIAPKEDIAVDVTFNYIVGYAHDSWYLSQFIDEIKRQELSFFHGEERVGKIKIRAQGSSAKAGRGYAIYTLVCDEIAHFIDTKGNLSGVQVINAYMPRLLPFGADARFIGITTPAGRSGIAWDMFSTGKVIDRRYILQDILTHGQQDFRAIFQLPTWKLNPLYPYDHPFLQKELKRDPWFFEREYGAKFADIISAFFPKDLLDLCFTSPKFDPSARYVITLDPSAGENDAYALAMGYLREGKIRVVHVRRWVPKKDETLDIVEIEEYVKDLCTRHKVVDIVLDQHLGMSTIQRLQSYGLPARGVASSKHTDVRIYQPFLELVITGNIEMPDMGELREELKNLQRIVLPTRYRVEAPSSGRDDMADCIGMLIYALMIDNVYGGMMVI